MFLTFLTVRSVGPAMGPVNWVEISMGTPVEQQVRPRSAKTSIEDDSKMQKGCVFTTNLWPCSWDNGDETRDLGVFSDKPQRVWDIFRNCPSECEVPGPIKKTSVCLQGIESESHPQPMNRKAPQN
eukprot:s1037_g11.t1